MILPIWASPNVNPIAVDFISAGKDQVEIMDKKEQA